LPELAVSSRTVPQRELAARLLMLQRVDRLAAMTDMGVEIIRGCDPVAAEAALAGLARAAHHRSGVGRGRR